MVQVEDGIPVPAGETVVLAQGGLHVMFMGLTEAWSEGDGVPVTLVFERAGSVEVTLPRVALRL
jgi:periplasmic copper chaperone A